MSLNPVGWALWAEVRYVQSWIQDLLFCIFLLSRLGHWFGDVSAGVCKTKVRTPFNNHQCLPGPSSFDSIVFFLICFELPIVLGELPCQPWLDRSPKWSSSSSLCLFKFLVIVVEFSFVFSTLLHRVWWSGGREMRYDLFMLKTSLGLTCHTNYTL